MYLFMYLVEKLNSYFSTHTLTLKIEIHSYKTWIKLTEKKMKGKYLNFFFLSENFHRTTTKIFSKTENR